MSDYDSTDYDSSEEEYEDEINYSLSAQDQWEESMRQIQGLFSLIIFPLLGKVLGRRFSHMIWHKVAQRVYA